jgi:serine protease Do
MTPAATRLFLLISAAISLLAAAPFASAQDDPRSEPSVLAVAKVLPAVVNINTERVVRRRVRDPFEEFAAQYFGNYRVRPREIRQTVQSLGSGFIVNPEGYIITNQHVVERAADLKIEVTMNDGKTYNARYITGDERKDLAFIKIDAKEPLPFISLEDISPNLLGQTVIVVGNALGYSSSISRGVLSGMNRDITIGPFEYKSLLQTDAAINPGNSGGPLIDLAGRLVGVSSAKMAFTEQGVPTQGLGFAIPAESVRESVEQFSRIAAGQPAPKATPGPGAEAAQQHAERLFGMQLQDLTRELADALGLTAGRGVLISSVEAGSPAQQIGVERGLVIYRVGRHDVRSVAQVEKLLARATTGTQVDFTLGIVRAGSQSPRLARVTLTAR